MHIHFEEHGTGDPLLLLHGFGGSSADWQHAFDLDALGKRWRVIRPDARCHGRSDAPCPAGAIAYGDCARDVLALMDRLGLARAKAVGASLGAKTLLHVATTAPDRLEAMVLVSASPRVPPATRTMMDAQGVTGLSDLAFEAADLARVAARTLLVAGDRDPLYPVELAVELLRGIPNASLYVVPGGGHGPIYGSERATFEARALAALEADA